MTAVKRIAIDVMGGDVGPPVTVPAAIQALSRHPLLELVLIGEQDAIRHYLQEQPAEIQVRATVLHSNQVICNTARPESILRTHRDSSMYMAVTQVQQGAAHACVSAGNTGALLLAGRHLLKNIPGIIKPAIMAIIPVTRSGGYSYLLDVGANVSNSAEELYQFGRMGAVVASSLSERPRARVALLNNGSEDYKGTPVIQQAAQLMQHCEAIDYVGFVEGNQLFEGRADVIVCDGFTGNITIKTSAGAVKAMQRLMRRSILRHWYYRVFSLILAPLIRDLQHELRPSRYNGATVVGLQGIVVKSHGNTDIRGFLHAIEHAYRQIHDQVPALIAATLAESSHDTNFSHSNGN